MKQMESLYWIDELFNMKTERIDTTIKGMFQPK